eukprot:927172-Rhodomonas_salina.2
MCKVRCNGGRRCGNEVRSRARQGRAIAMVRVFGSCSLDLRSILLSMSNLMAGNVPGKFELTGSGLTRHKPLGMSPTRVWQYHTSDSTTASRIHVYDVA